MWLHQDDDPFDVTEKAAKKIGVAFIVFWIVNVLVSLGVVGVAIWAVIKLVTHFTGS